MPPTLDLLGAPYDRSRVKNPLQLTGTRGDCEAYSSTEHGIRRLEPPNLLNKSIHALRTRDAALLFAAAEAGPGGEPGRFELYDLRQDAAERHDRIGADPQSLSQSPVAELKQRLRAAWGFARREQHGLATDRVDAATAAALVQLGYVSGTPTNAPGDLFEE